MSSITQVTMTNPFGENDIAGKVVATERTAYYLNGCIRGGTNQYAFQIWVKSSSTSFSIQIGPYSQTFTLTADTWTKCEYVTPEAISPTTYRNMQLIFNSGTYYLYQAKLEIGTTHTDWTPAPEDTETYVDNLVTDLQEQVDNKIQTYNQTTDPSSAWTTNELKLQHTGDLWYNPDNKEVKRWSGTAWIKLENKEAEEARELAITKAQVFTNTPTVPYYLGDLWFTALDNTGIIKTCIRTRTTGSFDENDWKECVKYTDDSKVNELIDLVDTTRALNIILDNEYQGISTDYEGNYTTFPSCTTSVRVFLGNQDVSALCTYTTSRTTGVTGSWSSANRTYTVTGLTTDSGHVTINAVYEGMTATKKFEISKIKGGRPGTGPITLSLNANKYAVAFDANNNPKSSLGVTLTAVQENSSSTITWSTNSGVTLGTTSNSKQRTLAMSDFSSRNQISVTITADGLSDTVTIVKVQDGSNGSEGVGYSIVLSNENHTFPATSAAALASSATCQIYAYKGTSLTTATIGTISGHPTGMTTSISNNGTTSASFTISVTSSMTKANGTLTVPITVDGKVFNKKFVYSLAFRGDNGEPGTPGTPGTTYFLQPTTNVIKQSVAGAFVPTSVTFYSYSRTGNTATSSPYYGRFRIFETIAGASMLKYTSGSNEYMKTYYPSGSSVTSIYCEMYAAGGTTQKLDQTTVVVVKDVDNLTQQAVFNALTNNGQKKGVYLNNGELYINATYIQSGTLKGNYIDAKNLTVSNGSKTTFAVDSSGNVSIDAKTLSIGGSGVATEAKIQDTLSKMSGNLLKGTDFAESTFSTYWDIAGTLTRNLSDPIGGYNAVRVQSTSSDGYVSADYNNNNPVRIAGRYEIRVWLKSNASRTIKISFNRVQYSVSLTTSWKQIRFSVNITTPSTVGYQNFTIGGWSSIPSGAQVYIYKPEIEFSYTPQDILNILTDNGASDAIYMSNNRLYIKATAMNITDLKAMRATIGGYTIGDDGIYKGTTSISSTTAGIFVGTTGIRVYKDANHNFTVSASTGNVTMNGGSIVMGPATLAQYGSAMAVRYGFHIYSSRDQFTDGTKQFKVYGLNSVTSGGHLVFGSDGATVCYSASSSKRYKNHVKNMTVEEAKGMLDVPVVWFKYKDGYLAPGDRFEGKALPGFYAEDIQSSYETGAQYNEDGSVEDWNHRTVIPAMMRLIQDLYSQIEDLKGGK